MYVLMDPAMACSHLLPKNQEPPCRKMYGEWKYPVFGRGLIMALGTLSSNVSRRHAVSPSHIMNSVYLHGDVGADQREQEES